VHSLNRKVTLRGVGSSLPPDEDAFDVDDAFNDDFFAAAPETISGSRPKVSCPPPSQSSRYAFVAPREREPGSGPVASDDAPSSRRRQTLRAYETEEDVLGADELPLLASG
jgi:hypothetical protein